MRAEVFTLKNKQGAEVQITNFGARVISIKVPDREGRLGDVVLGFDSIASYQDPNPYFGGIVGRYANRIAKGKFSLGGSILNSPPTTGTTISMVAKKDLMTLFGRRRHGILPNWS